MMYFSTHRIFVNISFSKKHTIELRYMDNKVIQDTAKRVCICMWEAEIGIGKFKDSLGDLGRPCVKI